MPRALSSCAPSPWTPCYPPDTCAGANGRKSDLAAPTQPGPQVAQPSVCTASPCDPDKRPSDYIFRHTPFLTMGKAPRVSKASNIYCHWGRPDITSVEGLSDTLALCPQKSAMPPLAPVYIPFLTVLSPHTHCCELLSISQQRAMFPEVKDLA